MCVDVRVEANVTPSVAHMGETVVVGTIQGHSQPEPLIFHRFSVINEPNFTHTHARTHTHTHTHTHPQQLKLLRVVLNCLKK